MKRYCTSTLYRSILLLLILPLWLHAQEAFTPDEVLAPDPTIRIGKLENGLTYYIKENKKPEKRAELRLVVKAGSIQEDDDQLGLAHFVEHMAFNGTKAFPKQGLTNYLEKSGVKSGAELNAGTSFDQTFYMLQVPTDSPAVMKTGFRILEEWAHNISFDDSEIDKERGVIVEEWRLGRGANERTWMKHMPVELNKSHYADRLPIGKKEIIESCPHDAIRRFYRDWYRPDAMAMIAVGDFNADDIEALVRELFSGLVNPEPERPRIQYPVPDHAGTLVSIVSDPELTSTSVEMICKRQWKEQRTAADYRRDIIGYLYSGMLNLRLAELVQKSNPPFIYAYCGDGKFVGDKQASTLYARVRENSILDGFTAALTETYRVFRNGFTQTELERQKAATLRGLEEAFKERDKTESRRFVDEYIRNFLMNEPIPGIERELALYRQYLPGITLEEVNGIAGERLTTGNRVVSVSVPKKDGVNIPTETEILGILDSVSAKKLDPYIDKIVSTPLMTSLPTPGKVVGEKEIPSIGVTEWKLSNGAKVVVKPTDFKNDEILFSAFSYGGTSLVNDSDYVSALMATTIVGLSGIGDFDAIGLMKKLAGKVVSVTPDISGLMEGFQGNASPQDIETLLQLVDLYATAPRRDTAAFASLLSRQKAMLENRDVSPEGAFNDSVQVIFTSHHFRTQPFTVNTIDRINLDRAMAIYKDRFADFSDFTFFFVGNIRIDSLKLLVEKYIAALPSLDRKETWRDVGVRVPQGVIHRELHRGIESKSRVSMTFSGPFEWTEQNRYVFASMINVLNIKLREVLREDLGGTYGVGVGGDASPFPRPEYQITIGWGCKPERVGEMEQAVLQQIDSLKLAPPDSIYIQKVSETQRRSYEIQKKTNSSWLWMLYNTYSRGKNPETILDYPRYIDSLTGKGVQEAAKKYFDMSNYITVELYPEK